MKSGVQEEQRIHNELLLPLDGRSQPTAQEKGGIEPDNGLRRGVGPQKGVQQHKSEDEKHVQGDAHLRHHLWVQYHRSC